MLRRSQTRSPGCRIPPYVSAEEFNMAGRPLHRNRRNPLVSWDRRFKGTPGSVDPAYAVLLQAEAEKRYRDVCARSDQVLKAKGLLPFRLSVIITGEGALVTDQEASDIAKQTRSVVALQGVGGARGKADAVGDPFRVTPFTPFNFFHRLEHVVGKPVMDTRVDPKRGKFFDGDIDNLGFTPRSVAQNLREAVEAVEEIISSAVSEHDKLPWQRYFFSYGVDTAAARTMSFINNEVAGDVFAKYVTSMQPPVMEDWDFYKMPDIGVLRAVRDLENPDEEVKAVKGRLLACLEAHAAYTAATFGLFIEGYYTGSVPEVDIHLSDNAETEFGEDSVDFANHIFSEEDARMTALFLLDRTRRGVNNPPGLFFTPF